jgi:hypothetical protein
MGDRYGRSDINVISMGISIIEMFIIDMGYGLMIWEMTVSIWSSSMSIWDILSHCPQPHREVVDLD